MERENSFASRLYMTFCLYALPLVGVAVHVFLIDADILTMWSEGVGMVILSGLLSIFFRLNGSLFLQKIKHPYFFWTSFGISCVLLGLTDIPYVGVLWMFCIVYACMDADVGLGACVFGYLMFAYALFRVFEHRDMYPVLLWIIYGGFLTLMFANFKQKRETCYLFIILETIYFSLQVIYYRFSIPALKANLFSIIPGMVGILFFVLFGYIKVSNGQKKGQADLKKQSIEETFSYEKVLDSSFALYRLLEKHSKELLHHSKRVAELSAAATRLIDGDELLVRAGGLYHEIGRITDNDNYIQAGLLLGEEMKFPKPLLDMICQHNASFSLPESKEASILMLSDSILTTSDILTKNGNRKNFSEQQLVHNVFQNRLKKGYLKKSTLTQEQIQVLEQFYIHHAFMEEEK